MVQQLRVRIALAEDLSSICRAYKKRFTALGTSAPCDLIHVHRHMHVYLTKTNTKDFKVVNPREAMFVFHSIFAQ